LKHRKENLHETAVPAAKVNKFYNLLFVKMLWLRNLLSAQSVLCVWSALIHHLLRRLVCQLKMLWERCGFVYTKRRVLQPVPVI